MLGNISRESWLCIRNVKHHQAQSWEENQANIDAKLSLPLHESINNVNQLVKIKKWKGSGMNEMVSDSWISRCGQYEKSEHP